METRARIKIHKGKEVYRMKKVLVCLLSMAFVLAMGGMALAKVTGRCDLCHTMHYSQNGGLPTGAMVGGPHDKLLLTNCAGCHTGDNSGTNIIPYVNKTGAAPIFGFGGGATTLAGGNFWWVKNAPTNPDAKGHNVLDLDIPQDGNISAAVGAPGNQIGGGCQTSGCHGTLAVQQTVVTGLRSGCQGCHLKVRHHADDGSGTKYVDSEAKGWYRFLAMHQGGAVVNFGVKGIEHEKWNYGATPAVHNEYLGVPKDKTTSTSLSNGNITAYCCGCHGNFHVQNSQAATGVGSQSPWLRHPSDFVLPNAGEYAAISTTYNLQSPVARSVGFGWTGGPLGTVAVGTDMVMCLSCHVPHGSPNDDLLRWDYAGMQAGGGGVTTDTGCFYCHTTKN